MCKHLLFLLIAISGSSLCAAPYTTAVLPKGNYDFWRIVHAGAIKAQQELGQQGIEVNLLWEYPERQEDSGAQAQIITRMTGEKVSGFVLAPMNSRTLAPVVEAAGLANIPTVVIDSNLRSNAQVDYIATENSTSGALAARTLGKLLNGKGRIIVFRYKNGAGAGSQRRLAFGGNVAVEKGYARQRPRSRDRDGPFTSNQPRHVGGYADGIVWAWINSFQDGPYFGGESLQLRAERETDPFTDRSCDKTAAARGRFRWVGRTSG